MNEPIFDETSRDISPSAWVLLKGLTSKQRYTFLASFLGWMLDAFDFFILVLVVQEIAVHFHTSKTEVTYAITLTLAMRPVGALLFGFFADRYGRRPTLIANVAFFSLMELLSGFAPTLGWLLVLRALFGLGMGGEWGVGASLVMETIPAQTRGVLSGALQAGYPVGYLLAAVIYRIVLPWGGWRWMFFVGAVPALLTIFIRASVEESPAWLQERELRLKAQTGSNILEMWDAVRNNWLRFAYLTAMMAAFNFLAHGTQDIYPSGRLKAQLRFDAATVSTIVIIYNLGALGGGILFGAWSQRIGRRRTIIIAALLAVALIPTWAYCTSPVAVGVAAFFMLFAVQGAWGIIPAHLNELSPAAVRGTFPGLAYQVGNLVAASTSTIQAAIARSQGENYSFALAVVAASAALVVATTVFFGPEAKEAKLDGMINSRN